MVVNVLFSGTSENWEAYKDLLPKALNDAGVDAQVATSFAPAEVDYIVYAPNDDMTDFSPYTRVKAVLSLWAGVEKIVTDPTLTQPLTRMVDDGLEHGMVEWVTGHVLRHHLEIDRHILGQNGEWIHDAPPLAKSRPVTILGLGALGCACAKALVQLGFPVTGWSRSERSVPGVTCLHGAEALDKALSGAQIVVLLLPQTSETENVMNARTFGLLAPGAVLINPGRGPLIDDGALIKALDRGQLSHATLDVFRVEPLPPEHPFWAHPKVTVTPHVASETRPETGVLAIARNIARSEAGEPLLHLVDRGRGY